MSELLLKLDKSIGEGDFQKIELFKERFIILWENWESLKKQDIKLGGSFQNYNLKTFGGPSCNIESFRLKGYYVDFRFFYSKKEPTHYYTISNLIGKYCHDERMQKCLKSCNKNWKDAGILYEWHGYKADDLLNYWFNGKIFHSESTKIANVKKILRKMNNDLTHHLLTFVIYDRMLVLRNINWILKPLSLPTQAIRLPEIYA